VKAVFAGKKSVAASASTPVSTTVSGLAPTTTSVTASASSPYSLTATVAGNGSQAPTGTITFTDRADGYVLGSAALVPGTTASSFQPQAFGETGRNPTIQAIADFNNDGSPDIALGNSTVDAQTGLYTLTVFVSAGNTGFGSARTVYLPASLQNPTAIAAGDFNNDGYPDLAVAFANANQVLIFLNDGQAGFVSTGIPALTGSEPVAIATGDFNDDGNIDLVTSNRGSSTVSILLGDGTGDFTTQPQTPGTSSFPGPIAVGDFNNDGIQDLAIPNYYSNNITVLLGNGDGTFNAAVSPGTRVYPASLAVGDFNADGKQDLAVVNQFSQTVTILLGTGNGTFTTGPQSPATGSSPNSIAVGDFNGDGIQDLAAANSNSASVTVLLGKGDGTFPSSRTAPTGNGTVPVSITVADWNGDGRQDFAVASSSTNSSVILLNLVQSSATAALSGVTVPGAGTRIIDVTYSGDQKYAASMTSTGLVGVPVTTRTTLSVEPSGSGAVGETIQLTASVSPSAVGNLTPTGTVSIYNGSSQIAAVPVVNGSAVYDYTLTAADSESLSAKYNGDLNFLTSTSGVSAFTVVAPSSSVTTLTVSSSTVSKGTIVTLVASVTDAVGGAVTQGLVTFCGTTLKLCEDGSVLGVAHLTSTGTATLRLALPVGTNPVYATFDGTAKVYYSRSTLQYITVTGPQQSTTNLVATATSGKFVFSSTVTGGWPPPQGQVRLIDTSDNNFNFATTSLTSFAPKFAQSSATAVGKMPLWVAVGDFNNDGKQDMAVANSSDSTVTILLGAGNGTFTTNASAIPPGANTAAPYNLAVGDFNGDGKLDLAVPSYANTMTILLGKGDGTFSLAPGAITGLSPSDVAAGDFNKDGKLDLAVTNSSDNTVTILIGNGDGTFTPNAGAAATGKQPKGIATADFDGDGQLDLAVVNAISNDVTILLGIGDGTFTPAAVSPAVGVSPGHLVSGDFNGDGRPDLAVANNDDHTVIILLNTYGGTFKVGSVLQAGGSPVGIRAGDLNGDGKTDLVVTNSGTGFTLFLGNGNGTFSTQTGSVGAGSTTAAIAVADFNGDGGPDLAITDTSANTVHVLALNSVSRSIPATETVSGGGTHLIEATFVPASSAVYTGNKSNPVSVPGTPIPTAVSLAVSPASTVTAGSAVTLNASVSPTAVWNYTLSGTVSFYQGTTLVGTATLVNGRASFSITLSAAGTYGFTAKYNGSLNFAASSSAVLKVTVQPAT
jgi:hypothetical protein